MARNVPLPPDLDRYPTAYCGLILLALQRANVPTECLSEVMSHARRLANYANKKMYSEAHGKGKSKAAS